MIKAGILGPNQKQAINLFRLLIHHPDVEIQFLGNDEVAGRSVASVYPDLSGDTTLAFAPENTLDPSVLDVLFLCTEPETARRLIADMEVPEKLRIVDLSGAFRLMDPVGRDLDFVYGVCELNRKALVRGAKYATTPDITALSMILPLLPLAKSGLLTSDINAVSMSPADNDSLEYPTLTFRHRAEVERALSSLQTDFKAPLLFTHVRSHHRGITTRIYFDCPLDIEAIRELYENFYDDHNFVFLTGRRPSTAHVLGTNKCMIYIEKSGSRLVITSVMDPAIKGDVGNAVHLFNLLFGLHERVGLDFASVE